MKATRLAIGIALLTGVTAVVVKARAAQIPGAIEGSAQWTPFEADFAIIVDGVVTTNGHAWRGADGSLRRDSYASQSPEPNSPYVVIFNIARRMAYYLRPPKTSWDAYPLRLPAKGYLPTRAWGSSMARVSEPRIGFQTVERVKGATPDERIVVAPELNFYPLLISRPGERLTQEITNVNLVVPPQTIFEPPAGAAVEWHATAKSIGRFERWEINLPQ
jgi:hypothetical protein